MAAQRVYKREGDPRNYSTFLESGYTEDGKVTDIVKQKISLQQKATIARKRKRTAKYLERPPWQATPGPKRKLGRSKEAKSRKRTYDRARQKRIRVKHKIEKEIEEKLAQLKEATAKLEDTQETLATIRKAPTIKEMRAGVAAAFREKSLSPIRELMDMATAKDEKGKYVLAAKDRMGILRFLAEYEAPKPKSVDIQADQDSNVAVVMVDPMKLGHEIIRQAEAATPEEYEEFTTEGYLEAEPVAEDDEDE